MKAYGEFIIVKEKNRTVTEAGIHLAGKLEKHYNEGVVESVGSKVEGIKEGDIVLYGDAVLVLETHQKDTYTEQVLAIRPYNIIGVK